MKSGALPALAERWLLPMLTSLVTLAVGVLHLRLDYVLFSGTLWGAPKFHGPPPGRPALHRSVARPAASGPPRGLHAPSMPFPFQLNEMFFLNFLSTIGLVLAFWIAWRWLVDVGILGCAGYSLWGWDKIGRPNPQGLGHISAGLEIGLVVLALLQLALLVKRLAFPAAREQRGLLRSA